MMMMMMIDADGEVATIVEAGVRETCDDWREGIPMPMWYNRRQRRTIHQSALLVY